MGRGTIMRIFDAFKRPPPRLITPRIALELIAHEAIVPECYKDSVGVWTWGVGVTNASGHTVYPRYLDKPQPLEHCLGVYLWLLEKKYLPGVLAAFGDDKLSEAQLGAALSFHYNTGAIQRASWVRKWRAGETDAARAAFMEWNKPASIIERREKERDLFFDGKWSGGGKATVLPVRKPAYAPRWLHARKVDVSAMVAQLLGERE